MEYSGALVFYHGTEHQDSKFCVKGVDTYCSWLCHNAGGCPPEMGRSDYSGSGGGTIAASSGYMPTVMLSTSCMRLHDDSTLSRPRLA